MTTEIESFIHYLEDVKQSSRNTVVSYQRDLRQLKEYLERQGIKEPAKVTRTCLNSYISYLERKGKATTTISRILASTKAFFHYELMEGNIRRDPAELLKTPKIEKKIPVILSVEEVNRLAREGMPFRDAYKKVGLDIEAGKFSHTKEVHHTHEGSIGNLCNAEISALMQQVIDGFNFCGMEKAEKALLGR